MQIHLELVHSLGSGGDHKELVCVGDVVILQSRNRDVLSFACQHNHGEMSKPSVVTFNKILTICRAN